MCIMKCGVLRSVEDAVSAASVATEASLTQIWRMIGAQENRYGTEGGLRSKYTPAASEPIRRDDSIA